MSVILIAILLSAALFAGIAAADEELLVNETQFIPPAEDGQGMVPPPMPFDNGTIPIDNLTSDMGFAPMPFDNGTMPIDNRTPDMSFGPMPLDNGTMPVDPAAIETAESPVPVLGIVAGLGAAVFFLTRRT